METRPASIAEVFVRNAERAPEKLCIRFEGENWSYGRLLRRVEVFAAALKSWGLKPGDRVALFLGNHPDFLTAYLGTHLASGVTVPVNKGYQRAELRHIFEDAGVRLCVTDGEGRFRTGDLGFVDEDGYFAISGRKKELIITGGYNVYPREVEEVLEGCPEVAEVAVVGLRDPEFVDALPRNALGKVLEHEVREKLTEGER